jgi:hypothetical protein
MGLSFFLRDAVVTTSGLKRFTPGVDKRVHLLLSAVLWTAVGMWLLVRGGLWLRSADALWLIIPALLLGSAKSLLILDRTAEKGIQRILRFNGTACVGAVYSIRTWLLVMAMMAMGYLLRHSGTPKPVLGALYITIGWALVLSSRHAWRLRRQFNR